MIISNKINKYKTEELWFPLAMAIKDWDIKFHNLMLGDKLRVNAYKKAIFETIKKGDVVVDIGVGTGILSKFAIEAGAKRVYGIEMNSKIIEKAKNILKGKKYKNKFLPINKISFEVDLPEKCDVIISEILGNIGDNEGMSAILDDARQRFLKKGGKMIPMSVDSFVVPISSVKLFNQVDSGKCKTIDVKYNINNLSKNKFDCFYDAIIPIKKELSLPQKLYSYKFNKKNKSNYSKELYFKLNKNSHLTGFKGFFKSKLSKNTILSIYEDAINKKTTSDCWKHCYMPIKNPVYIKNGDLVKLKISRQSDEFNLSGIYKWNGVIYKKYTKFSQTSKK